MKTINSKVAIAEQTKAGCFPPPLNSDHSHFILYQSSPVLFPLQYPPLHKPPTHNSFDFCKRFWLPSNPELSNAVCTAVLYEQELGIFINSCSGSVRWREARIIGGSLYKGVSIFAHKARSRDGSTASFFFSSGNLGRFTLLKLERRGMSASLN